nr:MAG TPA_asm: hypothetical protein [Caudoviricetes sp.]
MNQAKALIGNVVLFDIIDDFLCLFCCWATITYSFVHWRSHNDISLAIAASICRRVSSKPLVRNSFLAVARRKFCGTFGSWT